MDAQAFITREYAVTEAVSQAMLAVTSLRHLPPAKNASQLTAHALSTGYSPPGRRPRGDFKADCRGSSLLAGLMQELDHYQARVFGP